MGQQRTIIAQNDFDEVQKTSAYTSNSGLSRFLPATARTSAADMIYVPVSTQQHVSILILPPLLDCHVCYKSRITQQNSERHLFMEFYSRRTMESMNSK